VDDRELPPVDEMVDRAHSDAGGEQLRARDDAVLALGKGSNSGSTSYMEVNPEVDGRAPGYICSVWPPQV
jgi:hypothetical protein